MFKSSPKTGRILVIEDDWDILEVLKLLLEYEGHQVVTAKHGREALAAIAAAAKPFDVVVMDISMPEMGGIEVAQTLRANAKTVDIRIAIHTGLDEHWVRERFADYDLFLHKANDADVLVDEIATLLAKPRVARTPTLVASEPAPTFFAEDLLKARSALRDSMGLGPEALALPAFLELLRDEIGQLRRIGSSDEAIAALIGDALGKAIPPAAISALGPTP
jgi:CheY-like chemotaxis protein